MRGLPPELAAMSNALVVTDFAVDTSNKTVAFETTWTNTLFDYTDSRSLFLFSTTNLLEGRWTPLGAFLMPSDTNSCVFAVTTNNVDAAALPWFLDSLNGIGFYRFGVDVDSDGDGLADSYETLWTQTDPYLRDTDWDGCMDGDELAAGTDPLDADTDGDGMPDGWEMTHGLEPLADDACGDPDDDGLDNLREYGLGTSPVSADSDGDGLSDMEEVGWWEYVESMPVFDVSGGVNVLQLSQDYDDQEFVVPLPFAVRCGGYVHTNVTVCVNGVVALMADRNQDSPFSALSGNCDLSASSASFCHTTVAAYWDDLCAPSGSGARITVADVETNGLMYAVVEYSDMRLYSQMHDASCTATFQIVIPQAEPDTVYFHYVDMSGAFDGSGATIGVQLPGGEHTRQVSFKTAGAVSSGTAMVFRLGIGSDPVSPDTDGDGLDDRVESIVGASARYADTDLDGLPDLWEVENMIDPLSASGDDGASGDPDNDGLSNAAEYAAGSDPNDSDTDDDGLSDGAEVLTHGSDPLLSDTDGDWLSDLQEVTLGTAPDDADTDGDGLPDGWEVSNGLDPLSPAGDDGADGDPDEDGVDNLREFWLGTDPDQPDTDDDGLSDGEEAGSISFNPSALWYDWWTFMPQERLGWRVFTADDSPDGVRMAIPRPLHAPDATYTHFSVDTCGVFHLYTNSTDMAFAPSLPCRDLEHGCVLDSALTVAPLWAPLEFGTQSVVRAYQYGTAYPGDPTFLNVEYDRMRLEGYPDAPENEASVQAWVWMEQGVPCVEFHYRNVGSNVWNAASSGFRLPGGLARQTFSYLGSRKLSQGVVDFYPETGLGTDPNVADTDGDDLSDGAEVLTHGSDPLRSDTDGDGLLDAQEVTQGTSFSDPDTDGDGLLDGWEVANLLDPLSAVGGDGANGDIDNDGLTNLQEQSLGGNPRSPDTDGDGLTDAQEIHEGTDISLADTDHDGLTDGQEVALDLDPLQPDSDGDGMNDGWEYQHLDAGFDPAVDNATDLNPDNDADADPDDDGLTNAQECEWGTNPSGLDENHDDVPDGYDTDGDGVNDGAEIAQNSDPADVSDEGKPNSRVPVPFYFGDPSGSHSEKYQLMITATSGSGGNARSFSWLNERYGQCETKKAMLKPGWSYEVRLFHAGTNGSGEGYPDYDYSLYCSAGSYPRSFLVDDPESLFGTDDTSDSFAGEGKVATIYVLGEPKVIPDYNRDGKIDSSDESAYDGRQVTFRFWINDDRDSGNVNDSENDRPSSGVNGYDNRVNGRGDLLDFTPVLLDVSGVFPPETPARIKKRVSWKLESGAVSAVWTSLSASDAGSFHRTDRGASFGPGLSQNAHEATVTKLVGGAELPGGFVQSMENAGGKGVVMIEGCARGWSLKLRGYVDESPTMIVEGGLDIDVSSVEAMYRWMCLRNVCGDSSGIGSRLGDPSNRPDTECDGRHFVFVHGYNVDVKSARGWASEMFKRLWQSGSQSMFTAVDWFGNDSQVWEGVPFIGGEALDYYINVRHALDTALNFSVAANALPGTKVMLAHSLGNMIVSEAAKYHLLDYQKYYMLNAAVPMEAYDAGASAQEMIEHGWRDVDSSKWAANWYERISDSGDPRQTLKWRGRFAGIHDAINCYSPTEDILANASMNGWGGLWGAQELFKGTATLHLIPGNCEGGWGYNSEHTNLAGLLANFAKTNEFTDAELIASPIFRKFDNTLLHQTNLISIAQTELNKVMGDGIPARSFAAGRNPIVNVLDGNIELSPDGLSYWPSERIVQRRRQWHHSDICNVAFFYVNFIFHKIVAGENQ